MQLKVRKGGLPPLKLEGLQLKKKIQNQKISQLRKGGSPPLKLEGFNLKNSNQEITGKEGWFTPTCFVNTSNGERG
jgi:hypothetical protein